MASLHRIQWIDACIRQGKFPNITKLMERFEISRRQALRDIEYLRDSLGAPLVYCAKVKGYRYTDDSFTVPTQQITENQRELLSCLALHYEVLAKNDTRISSTFRALADLLLRFSGKSVPLMNPKFVVRDGLIPFRAILRTDAKNPAIPVPSSLKRFYRGEIDQQEEIFEFYDSHEFIPALLASGLTYHVVHPKWLRTKLVQYLERLRQINAE